MMMIVCEESLVLFSTLSFTFHRVHSNLFVVLLQGSQILTGFAELSLLHTLTDIPVNESTLSVHQVKLVVESGPGFSDGSGVRQHAYGTLDLGKITTRHNSRGLVVDTDLETSRTPVHKLNCPLGLDGGNSSIDVLGDDIASVQHAASHVLAVPGVALNHLVGRLKTGIGDLSHRQLFVISFLSRNNRRVSDQREMDTRVRHQVGLELSQIHIEGTIESEGCCDGGDNLANKTIKVGVGGSFDVQVAAADVIDSFVVNHESAVRMFQGGVGGQDGVVWFDNSS